MTKDEINEGFKLLYLKDKTKETYNNIDEFSYKIMHNSLLEREAKIIQSTTTESTDA